MRKTPLPSDEIDEALDWAKKHARPKKERLPVVNDNNPAEMPVEFQKATMSAVAKVQEILAIPLDPDAPQYGNVLRAQATVAGGQVNAQLKADSNRIKGAEVKVSYYTELRAALDAYKG